MAKTPVDFDNMSDEDFLKLDPEDFSGDVPEGETTLSSRGSNEVSEIESEEEPVEYDDLDGSQPSDDTNLNDESDDDDTSDLDEEKPENQENQEPTTDPMSGEGEEASDEESANQQSGPDTEEEKEDASEVGKDTPAKAGYYKLPEGMDTNQIDEAVGFFKKMTAPFKADGKDFSVRSADDAIRLMQQGVNYSRRMQELKPMKAMNRTLQDHNLADPEKLNFLIDLSKGNKDAIIQLLKSHKIDPMDLDIEKDSGYQARNYQANPQDVEFREALDMAVATPEGQALVTHIHRDWDSKSKAKLREDPSILGTLQQFKASGIYDKVVEELKYQQSIGYLQGVPFLQAFDQVGEAMKNAGVFEAQQNPAQSGSSMAPLQSGQLQSQPVASGARKQNTSPKKTSANPHLSSTPPSKQSKSTGRSTIDFDKLSDEEFSKLPPPE